MYQLVQKCIVEFSAHIYRMIITIETKLHLPYRDVILNILSHFVRQRWLFANRVTFAKNHLIHASDFPNLMSHDFIFKQAVWLKFSVLLVQ